MEDLQGIPNIMQLEDDIIGGGLPSDEALDAIKGQGFKAVIDLRTPLEGTAEMQDKVSNLGLEYYNIPVTAWGVGENEISVLDNILQNASNRPALIHCAVGGRVNMLWQEYQDNSK